jgi:hypothetical protein
LFTPTAAVFVEVGKSRTLRDSKLASDATAYIGVQEHGVKETSRTSNYKLLCKVPLLPSIGLVALVQLLQPSGPPTTPPPSDPLAVKYALELQSQFLGNKVLLYDNAVYSYNISRSRPHKLYSQLSPFILFFVFGCRRREEHQQPAVQVHATAELLYGHGREVGMQNLVSFATF